MKALTLQAINELSYGDVADAAIVEPTDALVRVTDCGVCGSELHIIQGREEGIDAGTVIGHEFVGEVIECGSDVRTVRRGDLVCSPFTTNCGKCFYCRKGLTCRCVASEVYGWVTSGRGLQGTHAEFVRAPHADSTLVKQPAGLTADECLLLGDNLSTGFYCAERAEVSPDGTYVVLGCGTVGVLAVAAARYLGANQVIAVDDIPWRRDNAKQLGASTACTIAEANDIVSEMTDGRGADAVLEAVGSAANELAFSLVRPGGIISSVGVPDDDEPFAFASAAAYGKNLTVRIGRCPARAYMERLATLLDEKRLDVSSIVTHRMSLADGISAYEMFAARGEGVGKVVLQP